MKTLSLLLITFLLHSCGDSSSSRPTRVTPKNDPVVEPVSDGQTDVTKAIQKKDRKRKTRDTVKKDPVIKKVKFPKNINIRNKKIWEFTYNGESTLLKCYDKSALISSIKLYSTNDGDTDRNLKKANDDLSFGYIPFDFFGINLQRWPQIDSYKAKVAPRRVKRDIRQYCNGKSYIYLEDYKKNLRKGNHHIVAEIIYYDNTVFFDYHNFSVE